MNKRIILPLDNLSCVESIELMKKTKNLVWGYKLRRQILEKGLDFIKEAKQYGKIMLDFKLYDIPTAITESLFLHINAGADITTIHCSALYYPNEYNVSSEYIAGVTILTSMTQKHIMEVYGSWIRKKVTEFTKFACHHDYGYIVCSSQELKHLQFGIRKICPGIRPLWYQEKDDQQRTMTPKDAINAGADLLVIGRPLLRSKDIIKSIELTNEEIGEL